MEGKANKESEETTKSKDGGQNKTDDEKKNVVCKTHLWRGLVKPVTSTEKRKSKGNEKK